MRWLLLISIVLLTPFPVRAVLIPVDGVIQIVGTQSSGPFVIAHISLSGSATITPSFTTDQSLSAEWVVFSDISGVTLENASTVGALGNLEVFGTNNPFYLSCTSCSNSADLYWQVDPTNDVYSFQISTTALTTLGSSQQISNLQYSVDLELPAGFSLASPVPETSTWVMLLIGFCAIGFAAKKGHRHAAAAAATA